MCRVLILGVALAVLQQVTGINVFLYFTPKIFKGMNVETDVAMFNQVVVGLVNMAFTILAVAVVDRVGRKPLMVIGAIGMGISLVGLGFVEYRQLFQWWASRDPRLCGLLRHVGRTGYVGHPFGDLPDEDSRPGNGPGNHVSVAGQLRCLTDLPDDGCQPGLRHHPLC